MVKLRVAARVIPEDDYLADLALPSNKTLRNEKRLLVLVRDPYKWQIGTLALEVQRAYKSCYSHDLPTIKYLKDSEDDCDLDPQLYVSDLLLDEGKAERDGADQRVTIKVILEQGRRVREGSVAVGNSLSDPHFQIQLQKTSRPPVPKFPGVTSSLGKRPQLPDDYQSEADTSKRQRQASILQPRREDSLISSIERDHPLVPTEVTQATESLLTTQEHGWKQPAQNIKTESPEYRRSWQDVPAASVDELEELEEQPEGFASHQRGRRRTLKTQIAGEHTEPNGVHAPPRRRTAHQHTEGSQVPITPPSEPSGQRSTSAGRSFPDPQTITRLSQPRSSTSASKFKKPPRKDIYDFPESDIDDSQMSPRSRLASLHHQKSVDRLSRIENQVSPELGDDPSRRFSVDEALDALDNESVFNDHEASSGALYVSKQLAHYGPATPADIFEDQDANYGTIHYQSDTAGGPAIPSRSNSAAADQEKENRPLPVVHSQPGIRTQKQPSREPRTAQGAPPVSESVAITNGVETAARSTSKKRERVRKNKSVSTSVNGGNSSKKLSARDSGATGLSLPLKSVSRNGSKERNSPSLDSPGEQLSQSLQESARKSFSVKSTKRKADDHDQALSSPLVKSSQGKKGVESSLRETSAKKEAESGPGTDNQELASPKQTKRQRIRRRSDANASTPSTTVQRSEEDTIVLSSPLSKPLPHWGSSATTVVTGKHKSPVQEKPVSLAVDNKIDSRKSPSIPAGLTEEEIKIVKSREGMTKEQYEADKKRKQLDAKKQAAEQRKKELSSRRESSGQTSILKAEVSKSEVSVDIGTSAKTSSRKSLSKDDLPNKKAAGDVVSNTGKSATSAKKPNPSKAEANGVSKTPAKTPSKISSDRSSVTTKSAKPTIPVDLDSKIVKPSTANKATEPTQKPAIKANDPPAPTIRGARNLKNLHQAIIDAHENVASTTTTSRASSRPTQKPSILNPTSDDDSDEDESSEDESESEDEKEVTMKSSVNQARPPLGKPDVQKAEQDDDDDDEQESSSESGDASDEDEYEKQQTEAAKIMAERRAKPVSRPGTSSSLIIGRPDPTIRDPSIDPSEDDDDDEL